VYLANPDKTKPISVPRNKNDAIRMANVNNTSPLLKIKLKEGLYSCDWYNPRTGEWDVSGKVNGGEVEMEAPGTGDWVLLLKRTPV
jgi:hypothetical protein